MSIAGGPAQLDTIPLATCHQQTSQNKLRFEHSKYKNGVNKETYFRKTIGGIATDFIKTILIFDYVCQRQTGGRSGETLQCHNGFHLLQVKMTFSF